MANLLVQPFHFFLKMWVRLQGYWKILLYLAVVGGVLAAAPIIGILVVRMNPILVFIAIALPILVVGAQLILPRPELGPLFILIAAAFLPLDLPTGTESRLVDSLLLTILFVGLWVLKMLVVDKRLRLKPSPVNKPLLGFIFIVLFSTVWSIALRDPLVVVWSSFPFVQIGSAMTMIMLPGAFLLVANHIEDIKLLKGMAAIMLVAGAVAAVAWLTPIKISFVNDGGLFSMWVVGIAVGLFLFIRRIPRLGQLLLVVLAGSWIYIRFFLGITWLSGWLPSFIILAILVFMRSRKLFLILLLLGLIFITVNADYYLGTVLENETNESGHSRLAAWEVNWRVTGKHLIFGTGPAGYAAYYMSYYPTEGMATHNNIIDILAQTGLVGLGLCLWFFLALAWQGYKLCLRLKGQGDFSEALANIAFAGTIGCIMMMVFGDWLLPFAYTQTIAGFDYVVYSWLFLGTIPVLDRLTQNQTGRPAHA